LIPGFCPNKDGIRCFTVIEGDKLGKEVMAGWYSVARPRARGPARAAPGGPANGDQGRGTGGGPGGPGRTRLTQKSRFRVRRRLSVRGPRDSDPVSLIALRTRPGKHLFGPRPPCTAKHQPLSQASSPGWLAETAVRPFKAPRPRPSSGEIHPPRLARKAHPVARGTANRASSGPLRNVETTWARVMILKARTSGPTPASIVARVDDITRRPSSGRPVGLQTAVLLSLSAGPSRFDFAAGHGPRAPPGRGENCPRAGPPPPVAERFVLLSPRLGKSASTLELGSTSKPWEHL